MLKPHTQALFDEYLSSHQHPTNRLTHKLAIPLIVLHLVAMLDWVPLVGALTLAHVAWVLASVAAALCLPLGRLLPVWTVVAIAVFGWLVQLAGHALWEKKSPSFFTNLVHALVGPLFFVALLTGDYKLGLQARSAPQVAR